MVIHGSERSADWTHGSYPRVKQIHTHQPTDEWACKACGQCRRFSEYTVANWATPLTFSCDCGAKSRLQRGIVRLLEAANAE